MITVRQSTVRGHTQGGRPDSYHRFSFGSFRDPNRMGFGNLRVLNKDTVIPGSGFPAHGHESMDIVTYVTKGQLRQEDNQGYVSFISQRMVQLMSAGDGVTHSERNASETETAHSWRA